MYRTAYQRGMLTIFFSVGSKPLEIWDVVTKDGYVSRFLDQDIKSMVLEIRGNNVSTTYMICPNKNRTLGISMPFLVMIVKNLKKYFSFEVTILDETSTRRRFRVSNFQSSTQIQPLCTCMPIGLSDGWNQIQFNLAEFTRRAYKKQFVEVQKLKINANIRLRRVYFTERLIPEDELPPEYKLFFPLANKGPKAKKEEEKENLKPSTSQKLAIGEATEEKKGSQVDIVKPSSKASVHSVKKVPSGTGSKAKIEEVPEVAGEGEAAVDAEAAVDKEEAPGDEGEATQVGGEETTAVSGVTSTTDHAVSEATPQGEPPADEQPPEAPAPEEAPPEPAPEGDAPAAEAPAEAPAEEAPPPTE